MYHRQATRRALRPSAEPIERFRESIALIILTLFVGWLLFGLLLLTWKSSPWVLISSVLLVYPVHLVIHYYFSLSRRQRGL